MINRLFRVLLTLLALTASAVEQNRFALTTLSAAGVSARAAFAMPAGHHVMPDGTLMAGAMHGAAPASPSDTDGRDDNTPEDYGACIAIAAMGVFTAPIFPFLFLPRESIASVSTPTTDAVLRAHAHPAYNSRAPPATMA